MVSINPFVLFHVLTITIGMFQFGYTISTFNTLDGVFGYFKGWEPGSTLEVWGGNIVTTCTNLGAMVACMLAPGLMQRGKYNMILANNVLVVVGAMLCLYNNFTVICIGRFILGMSAGAFTVFTPKFVNELAPTE